MKMRNMAKMLLLSSRIGNRGGNNDGNQSRNNEYNYYGGGSMNYGNDDGRQGGNGIDMRSNGGGNRGGNNGNRYSNGGGASYRYDNQEGNGNRDYRNTENRYYGENDTRGYNDGRSGNGGYGGARYEYRGDEQDAFYDRRGRRHYDNGRYAPMEDTVTPYRQYPLRPYPTVPMSPGMAMMNGDWGYDEPYRDTNMGFMHHKRDGYGFEMDGQAGDMSGYAKGRIYPMMGKSSKEWKKKEKIEPLDEETAEEWLSNMKTADGKKGEHFSMEQTKQLMKQYDWDVDPIDAQLTLNAMYSDYGEVAKKFNVDKPEFYVCLSKSFLEDPDAKLQGAEKLSAYYEYIVK